MGFDLYAKRAKHGARSYYQAGIEDMGFLRCAMLAAGVPETLVYKKFVSNDQWFITPRQSGMIAQKLTTWLRRRGLVLEIAETNSEALSTLSALRLVESAVGHREAAVRITRKLRAKSRMVRVDRVGRKSIRDFAAFCARSGGFYVA